MKKLTLLLSLAFLAAMAFSDPPKKDEVAKGKGKEPITDAQKKGGKEKATPSKDIQTKGKKGADKTTAPAVVK